MAEPTFDFFSSLRLGEVLQNLGNKKGGEANLRSSVEALALFEEL